MVMPLCGEKGYDDDDDDDTCVKLLRQLQRLHAV
jgi:hypothetical protein